MRKRNICSAIASGVLAINCVPMTTMAMTELPKAAEQQTKPKKEDQTKSGEENKENTTKEDPAKPTEEQPKQKDPQKPTDEEKKPEEDKPTQENPQKPIDNEQKPEEQLNIINLIIKQDIKSPKGADVDFFALIEKATNSKGVDISKLVKIDAGNFDKEKPGVYEIKYSYTDRDGKVTERTTKVTVVDDEKTSASMPNTGDSNSAIYTVGLLSSILAIFGIKKAKERE